jgi:hypothetical protein
VFLSINVVINVNNPEFEFAVILITTLLMDQKKHIVFNGFVS